MYTSLANHWILQLYQHILVSVERDGGYSMALRLCPLVVLLGLNSIEPEIRSTLKTFHGNAYKGQQHFLDPRSTSPRPIRTQGYSNTKVSKCVFVAHKYTSTDIISSFQSSKLNNNVQVCRYFMLFGFSHYWCCEWEWGQLFEWEWGDLATFNRY